MRCYNLALVVLLFFNHAAFAVDAAPATAFFPILPFDASPDAKPQLIPLATNRPMDGLHGGVTRAIIVIHDETRDAYAALAILSALAGDMNSSTFILAPQFLLPSDIARFADRLPDKGRPFAAWNMEGWQEGDDSLLVPAHKSISSFTVVDLLLMALSDRAAFPDIQQVVLAGFGAGANFVQRYAAFGVAPSVLDKQDLPLRFIVAGPSSFLYLTATRPLGVKSGFGLPNVADCPAYDSYPYGLHNLNPYARRTGANAVKTDYLAHEVYYVTASAAEIFPDTNCAAVIEGPNGKARATNYKTYLHSLYGDAASKTQIFTGDEAAKNDPIGLYGSVCGMTALFGDGFCGKSTAETE